MYSSEKGPRITRPKQVAAYRTPVGPFPGRGRMPLNRPPLRPPASGPLCGCCSCGLVLSAAALLKTPLPGALPAFQAQKATKLSCWGRWCSAFFWMVPLWSPASTLSCGRPMCMFCANPRIIPCWVHLSFDSPLIWVPPGMARFKCCFCHFW